MAGSVESWGLMYLTRGYSSAWKTGSADQMVSEMKSLSCHCAQDFWVFVMTLSLASEVNGEASLQMAGGKTHFRSNLSSFAQDLFI